MSAASGRSGEVRHRGGGKVSRDPKRGQQGTLLAPIRKASTVRARWPVIPCRLV